jgi:hypothetical protein
VVGALWLADSSDPFASGWALTVGLAVTAI